MDVARISDQTPSPEVDWPTLRAEAARLATLAYAPYSGLRVGAAGLVDDGRVVGGCNVENSSYGVTLCAECGLVSQLLANLTSLHVESVRTEVEWNRFDLLRFLDRCGFRPGQQLSLSRPLV